MELEINRFLFVILFGTVAAAGITADYSSSEDYTNASPPYSHSGTSESPETGTASAIGTIGHAHTEAPPPLHPPTTTTTTTTTTIRTPLPFEKLTNDLIQANNVSIERAQLNLARYETQLNLNALDMLLPKLRQLRQNMTNLLASPSPDYSVFGTQNRDLDEKLTKVELQISKNRNLLQRYEDMQRDTQKQLEEIYESLDLFLYSQVGILSDSPVSIIPSAPVIKTEEEISTFLNTAFTRYGATEDGGSNIQEYLEMLEESRNRIFAYNMTLQLIKLHGARRDTLFVQVAKNIFKYPELTPLTSLLPDRVKMIFTVGPKVIEMRTASRKLLVRSDGRVTLDYSERTPALIWKFYPLKNSEYFAIVDSVRNKGLGLVGSVSDSSLNLPSFVAYTNEDSIKDNYFYHWKIVAYYVTSTKVYYIKFINRQSGLALDVSASIKVVGQLVTDAGTQDWELH